MTFGSSDEGPDCAGTMNTAMSVGIIITHDLQCDLMGRIRGAHTWKSDYCRGRSTRHYRMRFSDLRPIVWRYPC